MLNWTNRICHSIVQKAGRDYRFLLRNFIHIATWRASYVVLECQLLLGSKWSFKREKTVQQQLTNADTTMKWLSLMASLSKLVVGSCELKIIPAYLAQACRQHLSPMHCTIKCISVLWNCCFSYLMFLWVTSNSTAPYKNCIIQCCAVCVIVSVQ